MRLSTLGIPRPAVSQPQPSRRRHRSPYGATYRLRGRGRSAACDQASNSGCGHPALSSRSRRASNRQSVLHDRARRQAFAPASRHCPDHGPSARRVPVSSVQSPSSDCRRQRRTLRSDGSGLSIGRRRLPVGGVCPGAAVPGDPSWVASLPGQRSRPDPAVSAESATPMHWFNRQPTRRRARRRRCSSSSPRECSASAGSPPPWRMPSSSRMWGSYIRRLSRRDGDGISRVCNRWRQCRRVRQGIRSCLLCRVVGRGIHARQCSELEHSLTTAFRKRVRGSKQDPPTGSCQ